MFAANNTDINSTEVDTLIKRLVNVTSNATTGGSTNFAEDLETTNNIVTSSVEYLLSRVSMADSTSLVEFNEVCTPFQYSNSFAWFNCQDKLVYAINIFKVDFTN